jgi:PTH1 family peptidyl-tRNA hydrolase
MKLIVGLGNPGNDYANTRHNFGYRAVEAFSHAHRSAAWKSDSKFEAEVAEVTIGTEKIVLAKPTTFMNLSGQSVQKLVHYYKLTPNDVWIVFDEADLNFGDIRQKPSTGKSTHNGIRSVVEHLGTGFNQLRLGIKTEQISKMPLDKFVLSRFTKTESEEVPFILQSAVEMLETSLTEPQ